MYPVYLQCGHSKLQNAMAMPCDCCMQLSCRLAKTWKTQPDGMRLLRPYSLNKVQVLNGGRHDCCTAAASYPGIFSSGSEKGVDLLSPYVSFNGIPVLMNDIAAVLYSVVPLGDAEPTMKHPTRRKRTFALAVLWKMVRSKCAGSPAVAPAAVMTHSGAHPTSSDSGRKKSKRQ